MVSCACIRVLRIDRQIAVEIQRAAGHRPIRKRSERHKVVFDVRTLPACHLKSAEPDIEFRMVEIDGVILRCLRVVLAPQIHDLVVLPRPIIGFVRGRLENVRADMGESTLDDELSVAAESDLPLAAVDVASEIDVVDGNDRAFFGVYLAARVVTFSIMVERHRSCVCQGGSRALHVKRRVGIYGPRRIRQRYMPHHFLQTGVCRKIDRRCDGAA